MAKTRYRIEFKPGTAYSVKRKEYLDAVLKGYVIPGDYRYGVIAPDVAVIMFRGCLMLRRVRQTDGVYVLTNWELIRRRNPSPCVEVKA